MRDDRQKFVHAGPGYCPAFRALGDVRYAPEGSAMKQRILAMGVNENVGVDGDQLPRPLYATSRSASHEAP